MSARWAVAAACLAFGAQAWGKTIPIELQTTAQDRPSHLCVVHAGKSDRSQRLSELITGVENKEWRPTSANLKQPAHLPVDVKNAFDLFVTSQTQPICGKTSQSCSPLVKLYAVTALNKDLKLNELYVTCRENAQRPAADRVLLITIHYKDAEAPAPLQDVHLNGRTAEIELKSTASEDAAVDLITVLGGNYQASGTQQFAPATGPVPLPVQPICRRHQVRVAPVATPRGGAQKRMIELRYWNGQDAGDRQGGFLCRREAGEYVDVLLPEEGPEATKRLTAAIAPLVPPAALPYDVDCPQENEPAKTWCRSNHGRSVPQAVAEWEAAFFFDWNEPHAPDTIRMHETLTSFEWNLSCAFPRRPSEPCPLATIPSDGIACGSTPVPGEPASCHYVCPARKSNVPSMFDLPAAVHFTAGVQEDAWDDRINYVHQTLDSYAARETRQFVLDVPPLPQLPGDQIVEVQIFSPSGVKYRYPLLQDRAKRDANIERRISVPGTACHDQLSYRYFGDRPYSERFVEVKNGRLVLDHPSFTARRFRFGALLGLGLTLPIPLSSGRPAQVGGMFGAMMRYQPQMHERRSVALDLLVIYMITNQVYEPIPRAIDTSPTASGLNREFSNVLYNRVLLTAAPVFFFRPRDTVNLEMSFSPASVAIGVPFFNQDRVVVGNATSAWAPYLAGAVRLSQHVALNASVHFLLFEPIFSHAQTEYSASANPQPYSAFSALLSVTLAFWL